MKKICRLERVKRHHPLISKGTSGYGKGPVPGAFLKWGVSVLAIAKQCPKWLRLILLHFIAGTLFLAATSEKGQANIRLVGNFRNCRYR